MIECKSCQYKCDFSEKRCPVCGSGLTPTASEISSARVALDRAIADKDPSRILTLRRFLADAAETESQREYAKLLEKSGDMSAIDEAMHYYKLAAAKNDPYSAYRYSRLVERTSDAHAKFWLRFSAILGSIDSYPDTAELFSTEGNETVAAYYCSLAAACDDTDSIVNMAKRWYDGVGVERSEAHAKWYLDKLIIPPISAIKLAYKLRSVKAEEPSKLSFPGYDRYLKSLSEEAQRLGFDTARFYLTYAMYKRGSANAEVTLAMLLAEGIGCESKPDTAYKLLESAISRGNSSAAEYLGREHLSGKIFKKSPELALKFFGKAAELGHSGAYEEMGDIYHAGEICEQDVARAIELYEMAAARGSLSADEKAKKLKTVRREYYLRGESIINRTGSVSADEAFGCFRSLAIATAMGEKCAPRLLAKCYAHGFGTEKDRATAFFWFERAVEVGDRNAYLPLALCYSRGFGTQFSYKKAVKYLKAAANAEYPGAAQELNTLYKRKMKKMVRSLYSTSVRLIYMRKYDEAARLLRSFESLAYPKALYTLGCLYEFGRGVDNSDRAMANKYYDMAYRGSSEFGSFDDKSSHYKLKLLKMIR